MGQETERGSAREGLRLWRQAYAHILGDVLGETCTSRARATSRHLCEGNRVASLEDGVFRTGTAHAVGLSVSCAGSKNEG